MRTTGIGYSWGLACAAIMASLAPSPIVMGDDIMRRGRSLVDDVAADLAPRDRGLLELLEPRPITYRRSKRAPARRKLKGNRLHVGRRVRRRHRRAA